MSKQIGIRLPSPTTLPLIWEPVSARVATWKPFGFLPFIECDLIHHIYRFLAFPDTESGQLQTIAHLDHVSYPITSVTLSSIYKLPVYTTSLRRLITMKAGFGGGIVRQPQEAEGQQRAAERRRNYEEPQRPRKKQKRK